MCSTYSHGQLTRGDLLVRGKSGELAIPHLKKPASRTFTELQYEGLFLTTLSSLGSRKLPDNSKKSWKVEFHNMG